MKITEEVVREVEKWVVVGAVVGGFVGSDLVEDRGSYGVDLPARETEGEVVKRWELGGLETAKVFTARIGGDGRVR